MASQQRTREARAARDDLRAAADAAETEYQQAKDSVCEAKRRLAAAVEFAAAEGLYMARMGQM
jgi:hypothetical protein